MPREFDDMRVDCRDQKPGLRNCFRDIVAEDVTEAEINAAIDDGWETFECRTCGATCWRSIYPSDPIV